MQLHDGTRSMRKPDLDLCRCIITASCSPSDGAPPSRGTQVTLGSHMAVFVNWGSVLWVSL